MAPVIGIIVFILLLVLDICGHRKLKVTRKPLDWGFLCFFAAGLILCITISLMQTHKDGQSSSEAEYIAYQYLLDKDPESARDILMQDVSTDDESKRLLNMLIYAAEGDYENLYFAAAAFVNDSGGLSSQEVIGENLLTIAKDALQNGTNPKTEISEQIEKSYELAKITETSQLQAYYETDSLVRNEKAEKISASKMEELVRSFPDSENVKKLCISYYLQTNGYDNAKKWAEELVNEDSTEENVVILADVYAQSAYQSSEDQIKSSDDSEIAALVLKANEAAQKAASYENGSTDFDVQRELANNYIEQAREVFYKRIENYLTVKKPVFGEKTGMIDLETIKMEVLIGNTEKAGSLLVKLAENASLLSDASVIKQELQGLLADIEKFKSSGDESARDEIFERLESLFKAQSQNVVIYNKDSINSWAANKLAAYIVYDRELIAATGYDVSAAPKIVVYANTNVRKENFIGGKGEFYKDDFELTDNGTVITDYTLSADTSVGDRSLAVALDIDSTSSDMLKNVKEMLKSLTADTESAARWALTDGNANICSSFSDTKTHFTNAVTDLTLSHEASCSEIIYSAIGTLTEKDYSDRVLVIVTDDLKLTQEEISEIIAKLKENNIACYVIAAPTADTDTAAKLANENKGISLTVGHNEELDSAMNLLTEFMNNCYTFIYKIDENAAGSHTVSVTLASEGISSDITYGLEESK